MATAGTPSNVPIPDPSVITQQMIDRGVASLKETLNIRLDSMDKASIVLSENVNRVPTLLDRETLRLQSLFDEKIAGIEKQFRERDVRQTASETAQKESAAASSIAAQTAVNAALQAQKEAAAAQNESNAAAITKSEASTIKQMDGILALLASNNNALNDKIAVINGRLDRGEGGDHARSTSQATMIAIAGVVAGFLGAGIGYIAHSSQFPGREPIWAAPISVIPPIIPPSIQSPLK